jgi:GH25 family lysozyme M1 (1,4-beta-N-acetylmuramidase)
MRARTTRLTASIVVPAGIGVLVVLAGTMVVRAGSATPLPAAVRPTRGQAATAMVSSRAISPAGGSGRAASHGPGSAGSTGHRQRVSHFNVGAAHSPKLIHQLGRGNPRPPLAHALRGIDVAAYQHPGGKEIDWRSVAKAGIQFAAIKATEGTYYKNPYALTDLARARAAGLSVMAYAFAIPNGNGGASSPIAQANYLINYLSSAGGRIPPIMLDIEYNPYGAECYGLSRAAMVSWITRFSGAVQARTGEDPIIYGPVPWWQECTGGVSRFRQWPLWVPDYTSARRPELTPGWKNWAFWQYSSAGAVNGIASRNTDVDLLNPGVIPLLDSGSQAGTAGDTVDLHVALADPVAGQALSFSARGLPAGSTISAAVRVAARPETAGDYHATVSVADRRGQSGSVSFSWTVRPAPTTGATGRVQLGLHGMCLTAAAGRAGNGTQAKASTCTGSSAQTWTYAQDNTLRAGRQCLAVPRAAEGAAAGLVPCDGAASQQWRLVYPRALNPALGPGHTALVNPRSGMCLADLGFGAGTKTAIALSACDGHPNEAWTLPPGPMTSQIPGLCLDDRRDQTANNTTVDLWSCNGTAAQAWLAEPDGTVRVHGKCLDVSGGATTTGSPVVLRSCSGTAAQVWNLAPAGSGDNLINPVSGLCLAARGNTASNGTPTVIATCVSGDRGMYWRPS